MNNRPTTTMLLAAALMVGLFLTTGCASPETRKARAQAEFNKGLVHEANGNLGEAEDCYEDAVDSDKNNLPALRRLAQIKTEENEPEVAIPLLKRVVELTDGSADAYNDLGYAYDAAGYVDPAEAAYLRAIQADPTNARARTNFGLMLARHGRTNEAILQLRAAMPLADAYYNVAVVLESQGKKARATREFQRALDTDPNHADAELHLAVINYENGSTGDVRPTLPTADVR